MNEQPALSDLKTQLKDVTNPQKRVDLLNLIVDQLRYSDPNQAIAFAKEARRLAAIAENGVTPYFSGLITSLLHLAYAHQWIGEYQKCLEFGEEALSFSKAIDNKQYQANALTQLANGYMRLGLYPTAYEHYTSAMRIAQSIEDEKTHCSARLGLGVLTSEIGNHHDAVVHFEQALDIARKLKLSSHHSLLLNNIAFVKYKLGAYAEVFPYAFEARQIAIESKTQVVLNLINSVIAGAYIGQKQYEEARKYLEPNLEQIQKTSDKKALCFAYQVLARLYQYDQQTERAVSTLSEALRLAEEIAAVDDQYEIHEILAGIYDQSGDLNRAYYHYRRFHEIKETVFSQNAEQKLRILEVVHQTEKARQEAEIYRLKTEELEQMVAERTAALTKRSSELSEALVREQALAQQLTTTLKKEEELSNLKSRIIETVSHEFRTPLTIINTSSQLLQKYHNRLSEEKQDTYRQRIHEAIFYINDLIDDAIFLSQTSRTPLQPVWNALPVQMFYQDLESSLREEFSQIELLVSIGPEPIDGSIVTDFQLVYHCVSNLVTNAYKYGVAGEAVQINVGLAGDHLHITVKDAGIGIPSEEQEKIFELFYRGSNVGHRRGLGLGLTIVQRICRVLEGEITVISEGEGKGSTFILQIPLKLEGDAKPQQVRNTDGSKHGQL